MNEHGIYLQNTLRDCLPPKTFVGSTKQHNVDRQECNLEAYQENGLGLAGEARARRLNIGRSIRCLKNVYVDYVKASRYREKWKNYNVKENMNRHMVLFLINAMTLCMTPAAKGLGWFPTAPAFPLS